MQEVYMIHKHSISACKNKKRQVTTTIDGIIATCSIKLQKEVKSNPKTAKL